MNKTADLNSFESGVPIADKARLSLQARCHIAFIDGLKKIFKYWWSHREHGAFGSMFAEHWNAVGPEGIKERVAELLKLANGSMHRDAKNPPAYFTQCAKNLLQGETT